MKKFLAFALVMVMMLSLFGCAGKKDVSGKYQLDKKLFGVFN